MLIHKKQQGFTLIEIMIVVTIMAIIGAFAYPSYVKQVQKSRRADAKIALHQLVQRQESYFSRNYSYAKTLSQMGYAANTIDSPDAFYTLSISAFAPSTCAGTRASACNGYTVQAVTQSAKSQAQDTDCKTFRVDHMGRKASLNSDTSPATTTETCW